MKNDLLISSIGGGAFGLAMYLMLSPLSNTQATQPASKHDVVILQGYQVFSRSTDQTWSYSGIGVYCSSSSSNAPVFAAPVFGNTLPQNPDPYANSMATLMDRGYRLDKFDPQTLTAVMIKD